MSIATKISLSVNDRVAAINPASGKIEKARVVAIADSATVGITFNAGEAAQIFDRSDVMALYSPDTNALYVIGTKATL